MNTLKLSALILILSSSAAKTGWGEPQVACIDGRATIHEGSWDTGCVFPSIPYFKTLLLESVAPDSGKMSVEMGYTFPEKDPRCNNPRGTPHFFYLPLPVVRGTYRVQIGEGPEVTVSLDVLDPICMIQTK